MIIIDTDIGRGTPGAEIVDGAAQMEKQIKAHVGFVNTSQCI